MEVILKSIISNERVCHVCGNPYTLHKHHIFGGGNRQISEDNGFWVYLCAMHHNMSDQGVHYSKELDKGLKIECQSEFERTHTREEFMSLIGCNYL